MVEVLLIPYLEEVLARKVSKHLKPVMLQPEHVNKGAVGYSQIKVPEDVIIVVCYNNIKLFMVLKIPANCVLKHNTLLTVWKI